MTRKFEDVFPETQRDPPSVLCEQDNSQSKMILLIDNYDSFVYNLARYFVRLGQATHVVRNDKITIDEVVRLNPDAIVLSPGPGRPHDAGICLEIVHQCQHSIPILGVCLGHQVIAAAFGIEVVRSDTPMHGRSSPIEHDNSALFTSVPSPTTVARYHSLEVDNNFVSRHIRVTAHTVEGTVMALQHVDKPVVGVQFHPESILTSHGFEILRNFLQLAGVATRSAVPEFDRELVDRPECPDVWPEHPITF